MTASLLDRIVIILVEPQQSGNVGASARAMKNMGLSRLVVVDPPAFDPHRARWMAPGCDDILAKTRFVATLDEAFEGVTRAIATTARHRRHGVPVLTPGEVAQSAFDAPEDETVAILFGREDHGLSNDAVERCEAILRIPTAEHASLNLAQAVLMVAEAAFTEACARGEVATGRTVSGSHGSRTTESLVKTSPRADLTELEPIVAELRGLITRVGYAADNPKVALTLRGALQRARLNRHEAGVLRGLVQRFQTRLPESGGMPGDSGARKTDDTP